MNQTYKKIVIVGAGAVGSTYAFALAQKGLCDIISILDQNVDLAKGQVLDLSHGLSYYPNVDIKVGDINDYRDASLIVITAGAKQKPSQTRLDLLEQNASIIRNIIRDIESQKSDAVLLIVTNPVDPLTYIAIKEAKYITPNKIIGSGTVLDSARFRYLLSKHCNISIHNVHAYVLGEHGDSEVCSWSMTHLAGIPIEQYCSQCRQCGDWDKAKKDIENIVKNSAYHIINYKGATYYAVAMALVRISAAILQNENALLTVSTLVNEKYGIDDVCLGVPAIIGAKGVVRIIEAQLNDDELNLLKKSAIIIKQALSNIGY